MKNKKLLVLSLMVFLSLVSCGGSFNGGSFTLPSEDNSSIVESNKDSSYSSEEERYSSNEETYASSENSSQEEVSSEVEQKPALMDYVVSLANNVDQTPSFILEKESSAQRQGKKHNLKDVTDAENNDNYQNFITLGGPLATNLSTVVDANDYINVIKEIKNAIVSSVICLNKWVDFSYNGTDKYRILYDQIYDQVTLEQLSHLDENINYYNIKSSYDANGNIFIEAYHIRYNSNTNVSYRFNISYIENQKLNVQNILHNGNFYENVEIIESDLTRDTPLTTALTSSYMDQGDRYIFGIDKMVYQAPTQNHGEIAYFKTYQAAEIIENHPLNPDFSNLSELDYSIYYNHYFGGVTVRDDFQIIADSNNTYVMQAQKNEYINGLSMSINPYSLDGIKSITFDENLVQYKMELKDAILESSLDGSYNSNNIIEVENDKYVYTLLLSKAMFDSPDLYLNFHIKDGVDMSNSEVIKDIFDQYQLSFKDETLSLTSLDDMSATLAQYDYGGISFNQELTHSEIISLFMLNEPIIHSYQDLIEFTNEEYVYLGEQEYDEKIFELYQTNISGNINLDNEEKKIDLSNISIELANSDLLVKGEEYSLVCEIIGKGINLELENKKLTFEGTNATLSLTNKVEIPNELSEGEYQIVVYLKNKNNNRLSSLYYPNIVTSSDMVFERSNQLIRVIQDQKIRIVVQDLFATSTIMVHDVNNQLLNAEEVSINLSGYNFLKEGDQILVSLVYLEGEEEPKVIASASETYGNCSANLCLPSEITLEDNTLEGSFKLVISIINQEGQEIYSLTCEEFSIREINNEEPPKDEGEEGNDEVTGGEVVEGEVTDEEVNKDEEVKS